MSIQSDAAKAYIETLLRDSCEGMFRKEYLFHPFRKWRFDYAVPVEKVAIEIQGGLFVQGAHSNPSAIRSYYEKLNAAASLGWRVWQYAPEQIIKAGRKTLPDEPILTRLPWL